MYLHEFLSPCLEEHNMAKDVLSGASGEFMVLNLAQYLRSSMFEPQEMTAGIGNIGNVRCMLFVLGFHTQGFHA